METTMYTFTANEIVVAGSAVRQASGGDRRMVYLRHDVKDSAPAAEGKVIDFNAWRAAKEEAEMPETVAFEDDCFEDDFFDAEFAEEDFPAEERLAAPAPRRPRTHHRTGGMYLDWLASAALIVVALCASVSFFLL